jgi:hypothetical protein
LSFNEAGSIELSVMGWSINMEHLWEWELIGESKVLGENLTHCYFVHQKSDMTRPGIEPWPQRWEAGD